MVGQARKMARNAAVYTVHIGLEHSHVSFFFVVQPFFLLYSEGFRVLLKRNCKGKREWAGGRGDELVDVLLRAMVSVVVLHGLIGWSSRLLYILGSVICVVYG